MASKVAVPNLVDRLARLGASIVRAIYSERLHGCYHHRHGNYDRIAGLASKGLRPRHRDCVRAPSGAGLVGARLVGLDLTGIVLDGADLTGADLTGARLHGAKMRDACLADTVLLRTEIHRGALDAVFWVRARPGR